MSKKQIIIFAILSFSLFSTLVFFSLKTIIQKRESSGTELPETSELKNTNKEFNQEAFSPTLTPEKEKMVSQLVTHEIVIKNDSFDPSDIEIKVNDQVSWQNGSDKNCKLSSDNWNGIIILPGESFTQVFDKAGDYNCFCQDNSELKGIIKVD